MKDDLSKKAFEGLSPAQKNDTKKTIRLDADVEVILEDVARLNRKSATENGNNLIRLGYSLYQSNQKKGDIE